jgi:hypothetical protein
MHKTHIAKDTKTRYATRYHVLDNMDTIQVVQVIIVVNTVIIIEMGMLKDGLLQRILIVMAMATVRADQVTVAVMVHNHNRSHKALT